MAHEAHDKPKKRVRGVVDRVEGGIVVVVVAHPNDPDATIEIYVPKEKFKKKDLREGDRVTVLVDA
jgi:transcription termination factor Rho